MLNIDGVEISQQVLKRLVDCGRAERLVAVRIATGPINRQGDMQDRLEIRVKGYGQDKPHPCPKCDEGVLSEKPGYCRPQIALTSLGIVYTSPLCLAHGMAEHLYRTCDVCGYEAPESCKDVSRETLRSAAEPHNPRLDVDRI